MGVKQAPEVTLSEAIKQAPAASTRLQAMAEQARVPQAAPDTPHIYRDWVSEAGTYCYHTHIAVSGQSRERFEWAVDLFFNAASLDRQPWYDQFLGGVSETCDLPTAGNIESHQLCLGRFDLGLGAPRAYRQLVSLHRPEVDTGVIVARSILEGPSLPDNTKLAYTVDPNGEVLHWDGKYLHWHHICSTPGASLLPQPLDRLLINLLRVCRLDSAERRTYRHEAEGFRDWLEGTPMKQWPELD